MKRLTWLGWMVSVAGLLAALCLILPNGVRAGADETSPKSALSHNAQQAGHAQARHDDDADDEDDEDNDEDERTFCFSQDDLGHVPQGWTVAKTGRGEGSAWKVVADPTAPSKTGRVLAQTAKSPDHVFNLCVVDDSNYRDVEIEVAFKAVRGQVDQGGGVVWRYRDANNYYIARMNPLEDNFRVYKVVNGRRKQLASKGGLRIPAGQWHTLEIECEGNEIECSLDDKELLEARDDTFRQAGKVGLWTKADARTYFDKFTVEKEGDEDHDEKE